MIRDIQTNSKRMRLLQILGQQLELLINEGQPYLHSLFVSLKAETLVSNEFDGRQPSHSRTVLSHDPASAEGVGTLPCISLLPLIWRTEVGKET
jgi:hypothetical protein